MTSIASPSPLRPAAARGLVVVPALLCCACSTLLGIEDLPGPVDGGSAGDAAGGGGAAGGEAGGATSSSSAGGRGGDAGGCPSVEPPGEDKRVFLSSKTYTGDIRDIGPGPEAFANADAQCQELAELACMRGTFMAWLSDSVETPLSRFEQATSRYVLVNREVVADSFTALLTLSLQHAIDRDESNDQVTGAFVWTGTNADGSANSTRCNDWASAGGADHGVVGSADGQQSNWTNAGTPPSCNALNHLYCFEQ